MLTQLKTISDTLGPVVGLIGGILGIIALAITGVKPLITYIKTKQYHKYPFEIWFTIFPFQGKRYLSKAETIGLGESRLTLRIRPKQCTVFEEIHIMFVSHELNAKSQEDDCPTKDIIHIKDMYVKSNDTSFKERISDNVNGIQAWYKIPYRRFPEENVYIEIIVKASQLWNGKVLFMTNTSDNHLGKVYLDLNVVEGRQRWTI